MNKIYVSGNYIIVEDASGKLTSYPKSKSEYCEQVDCFVLRKYPNKAIVEFKFAEIGTWFNEAGDTAYTEATLRTLLRENTDFSSASGGSGAIPITQSVNGHSNFVPGTEVGELAYSKTSEGTRWLPGTIGGTYYPKGFYIWDGNDWVSDRNAIAEELDNLLNSKQDKDTTGWWTISDTTFTSATPQSIPANTRTLLQINLDSVIEFAGANGALASDIWDAVNNKLTPLASGDSYLFRLSMTANPTLNNRNFTVDLDIGGTQGVIFERSTRLARGANVDTKISMTNSIFTLGTFIANGGEIYITCDGDVEIFDISLFIQKVTSND